MAASSLDVAVPEAGRRELCITLARQTPVILVVMGISGSGKTHVGSELAARLRWKFFDADDLHPAENIERMSAGVPLSDDHREPWLATLQLLVSDLDAENEDAVLACSALRRDFRRRLRQSARDLHYVYLRADESVVAERMRTRSGHFMKAELLPTQFAALEEPDDALLVNANLPSDAVVDALVRAVAKLREASR